MFFNFFLISLQYELNRTKINSSFVKLLDDQTMRETIKKVNSSFVFFHADHLRLSDVAYLRYLKIAKKYQAVASFFVVPATSGADVYRTYSVSGSPSLFYFHLGTKFGIHYGLFSEESIERFISNWTQPPMITLKYQNGKGLSQLPQTDSIYVLFLGDNNTKFGRTAIQLANELSSHFRFYHSAEKEFSKELNVRFPSLVLIRLQDSQKFEYTGEPDVDEMFIWLQHHSIPSFKNIDYLSLFSSDGVLVKSVIALMNHSDQEERIYPKLGKMATSQKWIRFFQANVSENKNFVSLFDIHEFPVFLYISANYSKIDYAFGDESLFEAFYDDKLKLKSISTPPSLYNNVKSVTEFAFEKLIESKSLFTLFTSAFCLKCKNLKQAYLDAVSTISKSKTVLNWAMWDVTQSSPSFQQNITLGIPSIWYFNSTNVFAGESYSGPTNYLSIIEWISSKSSIKFDLDSILRNELGSTFDQI